MRVCFVKSSRQNVFFDELLEALRGALSDVGIETATSIDCFPQLADDLVYLVVPHEFVPMTFPQAHPTASQLRRTIALNTEQPGTAWFEETAAVAEKAGATLDIQPVGIAELRRRGIRAERLALGYVPAWDRWGGDDRARAIDAIFLGGYTERRAKALATCASVLQHRSASLHLAESWRPQTAADKGFLAGERKFTRLADSRVLVNVHRSENAYFEWVRLAEAMTNGCVVLTEHSSGHDPLVPGEHFVSTSLTSLPTVLDALLRDEDRLRAVRHASYAFLQAELPLSAGIAALANAAGDLARRPIVDGGRSTRPSPAPRPIPTREAEWASVLTERNGLDAVRIGVKRLMLDQRRLARRVDALANPRQETVNARTYGPYDRSEPQVSVVLTLFNYERVVEEALESVALSTFDPLEVLVVDDASSDGSLEAAEEALGRLNWLPAKILARSHNGGLPAARNLGIEHARGEHVFVLDADNAVYPHAIERLHAALVDDEAAAFAYGILEKFDVSGPFDLVSWHPWDSTRFRHGNFIDAMALIRRSALKVVGGFLTDERIFGWEDFALWCAFAQEGFYGIQVPEIVARYRAHAASMISLTNIDTTDAWAFLLERFPFLRQVDESGTAVR